MNTLAVLVDHQHVGVFRQVVEDMLSSADFSSPVLFTVDDIFERLHDGRMQLWLWHEPEEAPHLMAITYLDRLPQGTIAHVFLAAGQRIRGMVAWSDRFEEWCRMLGALYIHLECSPKLAKILERRGYVTTALSVYKPLYTAN